MSFATVSTQLDTLGWWKTKEQAKHYFNYSILLYTGP